MRLEVISRFPSGKAKPFPLLFVHGSNSGAWVWDEHFLRWFADRGYATHALSLRGHGNSKGYESLYWSSLYDFVEDVAAVVAELNLPPVIIGHSMGGMVVQKYLQHYNSVPGIVLMASVPPQGLVLSAAAMAMQTPILFQHTCWLQATGFLYPFAFNTIRQILFSKGGLSELTIARYYMQMRPESYRVVADMMAINIPRPDNMPPLLVMGAEADVMIPPDIVHATAQHYRTTAIVIPAIGHAMMLDLRWEEAANCIWRWLEDVVATKQPGQG
jgi:non-heme chloroperoxidase